MTIETTTMVVRDGVSRAELGEVWWAAREGAVLALGFATQVAALRARVQRRFPGEALVDGPDAGGLRAPLQRYFAGELRAPDGVPIDGGGTPFQARVWRALRDIPPAETRSYAQLAAAVGEPRAVRAVGTANGQNPLSLLVPCHRVIGKDGALRGYAGGLPWKRWLLDHEQRA